MTSVANLNAHPHEEYGIDVAVRLGGKQMPDSRTIGMNDEVDIELFDRDYDTDTHRVIIWNKGNTILDIETDYNIFPKLAQKILEAYQGS